MQKRHQRSYSVSSKPRDPDYNPYEVLPAVKSRKFHSGSIRVKHFDRSPIMESPPPLPPPRLVSPLTRSQTHTALVDQPPTSANVTPNTSPILKPRNRLASSVKAALRQNLSTKSLKPPPNEPVQLSQFATRYPNSLPVRVQVRNGFCSRSTDLSISQNEHFNLHFIKHTKVVTMRDGEGKQEYAIPLNSMLEFGLVYDPHHNEEEAKKGIHFETAADIMSMKPLPKVIRATKSYDGSFPDASVKANELLIVQGVQSASFPGRGKILQVHSLNYGRKNLSEKCMGGFTTRPQDVHIPLSTMVQFHFSFPQKAIIFGDREVESSLPVNMDKSSVILEGYSGETSIIATTIDYDMYAKNAPILEFLSDLDVQLQVLTLAEGEEARLAENTLTLYRSFTSYSPQVYMEKTSSRACALQSLLYKKVAKGRQPDGIQLVWPILLDEEIAESSESDFSDFDIVPEMHTSSSQEETPALSLQELPSIVPPPLPNREPCKSEGIYQKIDGSKLTVTEGEYIRMTTKKESPLDLNQQAGTSDDSPKEMSSNERMAILEQDHSELRNQMSEVLEKLDDLGNRVKDIAKLTETKHSTNGVGTCCKPLQEQIRQLHKQAGGLFHDAVPQAVPAAVGGENREILASMGCNQVR